MGQLHNSLLEESFFRSWWVVFFVLLCYGVYEHAMIRTNNKLQKLESTLSSLSKQREEAMKLQSELTLQLEATDDSAWIELTLMRVLGMVPEGQTKVLFEEGARS